MPQAGYVIQRFAPFQSHKERRMLCYDNVGLSVSSLCCTSCAKTFLIIIGFFWNHWIWIKNAISIEISLSKPNYSNHCKRTILFLLHCEEYKQICFILATTICLSVRPESLFRLSIRRRALAWLRRHGIWKSYEALLYSGGSGPNPDRETSVKAMPPCSVFLFLEHRDLAPGVSEQRQVWLGSWDEKDQMNEPHGCLSPEHD